MSSIGNVGDNSVRHNGANTNSRGTDKPNSSNDSRLNGLILNSLSQTEVDEKSSSRISLGDRAVTVKKSVENLTAKDLNKLYSQIINADSVDGVWESLTLLKNSLRAGEPPETLEKFAGLCKVWKEIAIASEELTKEKLNEDLIRVNEKVKDNTITESERVKLSWIKILLEKGIDKAPDTMKKLLGFISPSLFDDYKDKIISPEDLIFKNCMTIIGAAYKLYTIDKNACLKELVTLQEKLEEGDNTVIKKIEEIRLEFSQIKESLGVLEKAVEDFKQLENSPIEERISKIESNYQKISIKYNDCIKNLLDLEEKLKQGDFTAVEKIIEVQSQIVIFAKELEDLEKKYYDPQLPVGEFRIRPFMKIERPLLSDEQFPSILKAFKTLLKELGKAQSKEEDVIKAYNYINERIPKVESLQNTIRVKRVTIQDMKARKEDIKEIARMEEELEIALDSARDTQAEIGQCKVNLNHIGLTETVNNVYASYEHFFRMAFKYKEDQLFKAHWESYQNFSSLHKLLDISYIGHV